MRQAASVISFLALLSACASTGSASPSVVADDAVLVIGLTAPSGEMGEWARTAQPVLESIRVAW